MALVPKYIALKAYRAMDVKLHVNIEERISDSLLHGSQSSYGQSEKFQIKLTVSYL
jgi:hypothetical protein